MAFQFKLRIEDTKPAVWRRIMINQDQPFSLLHEVIQGSFGWQNTKLFEFTGRKNSDELYRITMPDLPVEKEPNFTSDAKEIPAAKITLSKYFTVPKQSIYYLYNFDENWVVEVLLEKILPHKQANPEIVAGKGSTPIEDVGGPYAYQQFVDAINDPDHPEYAKQRKWLNMPENEEFDPEYFDLYDAQNNLEFVLENGF